MALSSIERERQRRLLSRVIFLAAIFLSLVLFLSSRGNEIRPNVQRAWVEDGISPILTYASMPLRGVENILFDLRDKQDIIAENERLKREISQLRDSDMRANALAMRIQKYETLLNIDLPPDILATRIAARAVSESDSPFVRSALINAGAQAGVQTGNAVITNDGVYGHIVRTGQRSARVLQLTDLNSRVPVMSLRTEGRAILSGNNTDYPTLSYITNAEDWVAGDQVVTSGDDGIIPRGLPIGTVEVSNDGGYRIKLLSIQRPIDWVMVIPFVPVRAPEDTPEDTPETVTEGEVSDTQSMPPSQAEEPDTETSPPPTDSVEP